MPAKAKAPALKRHAQAVPCPGTPLTLEERVRRIEAMGQRIDGYIRSMCQIASLNGSSAEAKERAVTTFYEQMIVVESQLGRIHGDLQLE